jgi:hypothetical protein
VILTTKSPSLSEQQRASSVRPNEFSAAIPLRDVIQDQHRIARSARYWGFRGTPLIGDRPVAACGAGDFLPGLPAWMALPLSQSAH